jgi:hypothetical protein
MSNSGNWSIPPRPESAVFDSSFEQAAINSTRESIRVIFKTPFERAVLGEDQPVRNRFNLAVLRIDRGI